MRHKRSLLALEKHGAGLQCLQVMPHTFLDVHTLAAFLLAEHDALYHRAVVVVRVYTNLAAKHDEGFIFCRMPMYLNLRSWLHCVQHPMTLISSNDLWKLWFIRIRVDAFACADTLSIKSASIIYI